MNIIRYIRLFIWGKFSMLKKHVFTVLIIFLMFILVPASFASDENTTNDISNDVVDTIDSDYFISENSLDEIHVDVEGSDDNAGDYNHPLLTINKAISVSSDSSKIIVHEGTYRENNLNINKSLEIQGQGNVIIDAENKNRIFTIHTSSSADRVILSGITFINGNSQQMAGAIYVMGATTTINNCKFINNTAATEGGAIFWNSEHGILSNTLVENNYARDGSGVKWGESESGISFGSADYGQIINCTFSNNHLMQDEDACIGLTVYSNHVKVINSRFVNHTTRYNSSFEVLYINGDSGTVEGCLFANNSMTLAGALGLDGNYAVAKGNRFINNTVSFQESFGGAIGVQSETANIINNTFISNGGDECYGGAVYINIMEDHQFSFINITKNIFIDNTGIVGGAIYANGQGCMLELTIKDNIIEYGKAQYGAGVYVTDIWAPVKLVNNSFNGLFSEYACGIYSKSCILEISNNLMTNCTSINTENIYSNNEVKGNLKLKFNDVIGALNQKTVLTAILIDDMGNHISATGINFKVDGVDVVGVKGLNSITAVFDTFGNHSISGSYESLLGNIESGVLTILHGVTLKMDNFTNYGKKTTITINLTDEDGNPFGGADLILNVNNNDILLRSDEKGIAQTTFDFSFGTHYVTARFDDNRYYKSVNVTASIQVLSSIESNDLVRAYNSGNDFQAKLFNSDGTPLANEIVTFKVNGKKYDVKTDSNGVALLNQKFGVGFYTVSIINPITTDEASNTLSIVKRITDNQNINCYYGSGSVYKVRVYDDNGNPVGSGQTVKFNVGGKSYNVKTDKDGYASFKITLKPKTYTIVASYKDFKVSNKVVIKPVLTAKDISKKKAKKIKFKAKLVNTKGKALKGKKITFKIKGKTYKAKTNKKGIATLTLKNLKVGKYKVKTTYGKSTIKNVIKVRK